MKPIGLRRVAFAFAIAAGVVVACSLGDIDLENKVCPCGDGWVCDTARNVGVRPE